MDIRRVNRNVSPNLYGVNNKDSVSPAEKRTEASKTEKKDKINISEEAKNLSILDFSKARIKSEMTKELADVSAEKINKLKEQIKSGMYKTDSKDIAAAIIEGKKQ